MTTLRTVTRPSSIAHPAAGGAVARPAPTLDPVPDRWMVLWTKPRQEKAVAKYLGATRATYELPLVERVTISRGRKSKSMVPLFPGYVFLHGTLQCAYDAIATRRVSQLLEVPDQDGFVRQLDQIRLALEADGQLELYPFAVVGRKCRVTRGPFLGIVGVITDRLGPSRLALQIDILGRGAALEIDNDLLEPVDD